MSEDIYQCFCARCCVGYVTHHMKGMREFTGCTEFKQRYSDMKRYDRVEDEPVSVGIRAMEGLGHMLDDNSAAEMDKLIPDWTYYLWDIEEQKVHFFNEDDAVGHTLIRMR